MENSIQRFHIHRFEFKYILNPKQYAAIKEEILNYADYDPFSLKNPDKFYMVYSLYYDTPTYSAFWDKVDSLKDRKKIRFRVYDINSDNHPDIYLEIKRKKNVIIIKDRAKIDYKMFISSFSGSPFDFLKKADFPEDQKKVAEEMVYDILRFNSVPTLMVAYKREAFFSKYHSNTRITFDSEIKSYKTDKLFKMHKQPDTVLSKEIILELKFNGSLPSWCHHIIQKYDLVRDTHSKYCNSMIKTLGLFV